MIHGLVLSTRLLANKLSPEEEQTIPEQAYAPEFADSSSKQIVPQLADNRRPFYPLPIRLARTEDRGSISVNSLMGEGVKPQLI